MRRRPFAILRRLINLVAALSFVLCGTSLIGWVRSMGHFTHISYGGDAIGVSVASRGGSLAINYTAHEMRQKGWSAIEKAWPQAPPIEESFVGGPTRKWWPALMVERTAGPPVGRWKHGGRLIVIIFTGYWLPTVAGAVLPSVRVAQWVRRRRRSYTGRCVACGYDLRASPGRCPECGSVPAPAPRAAA